MGAGPSHRMAADGALLIYNVGPEAQGRWGTYMTKTSLVLLTLPGTLAPPLLVENVERPQPLSRFFLQPPVLQAIRSRSR